MSDRDKLRHIVDELDYLLAERSQKAAECPRIIVFHGHHQPGTLCLPGETVEKASLWLGSREMPLHLSPTGLLILDCLSRFRQTPLCAAHIERILASDPFYVRHGANALCVDRAGVRPKRASIKVYIQRIRLQLGMALGEAGLNLNPSQILTREATDSNIILYRLKISVEFRHRQQ